MLVDTSVWIDHLRRGNATLASLLASTEVYCHPLIIGELACGNLRRRQETLALLRNLPEAPVAEHQEALQFVESHRLMGSGMGWIDVHLMVSANLAGISFWTLDRRLSAIARRIVMNPS